MDTQALKAFLAVADQQSFSLAAEQLFLTQSAVSKRVQLLESQLSTSLFDRHNRTISLTEAGMALLPKARQILDLVADTELQLMNLDGHVSGVLSLATSHHIGLHRLPPVLREFTARYPNAQLNLSFMGSERAYQAVEQRQVELALTTLDGDTPPPDTIEIHPLWQDDMICVCAPEHPLASLDELSLSDLAAAPAILPEQDTITFHLVERVFHQAGLRLNAPMPTNYLETIKMMVSVGMGWSLLPASMLDEQLVRLHWPASAVTRQLGLIHLRQRTLSNAARAFREILFQES
ncbi:LysR family transcriptional regulator [Thalassolituus sp. LLYu03]|uniref:LysR family transcriptional regulator n=1 Tax=Thalassolituus sp. LLYu03 TaxID=3421656 RepID=UPI003D2AAF77